MTEAVQISCRSCTFCRVYEGHGNCRRLPPRMNGDVRETDETAHPHERLWAVWPVVNLENDWCGEWRGQDNAGLPF